MDPKALTRALAVAHLTRLKGLSAAAAVGLARVGIDTIAELGAANPESLYKRMAALEEEAGKTPAMSAKKIGKLVKRAKAYR